LPRIRTKASILTPASGLKMTDSQSARQARRPWRGKVGAAPFLSRSHLPVGSQSLLVATATADTAAEPAGVHTETTRVQTRAETGHGRHVGGDAVQA